MVEEGLITPEEAVGRIEPAHVDQLLRATVRPGRPRQGDQDRQRPERLAGGRRRARGVRRRHGRRVGRPRREGDPRPDRDLAGRLPRHGRGRGDHHRPRRRHLPRGRRRPPDRQAMRGRLGRPDRRLRQRPGPLQRHRHGIQGGRLGQPRWIDRRPLSSARCRPSTPGSRTSPSSRRSSAGPTRSAGCRSGRTPTSPRRRRRRAATARRASACAGPSTCSARASGSRSCVARSSSPTPRRGPRPRLAAGGKLDADEAEAVATFDAAMAKLEVLQQGDFEGIFRAMDSLPVVIRLIDPPLHEFLPNLEEQLVKVTKAGDAATEEDKRAAGHDQEHARAEPDARPARLPARADDPGLREGPDPGDPQRAHRGHSGRRASRRPRS